MGMLVGGLVAIGATAALFWYSLPRDGKLSPVVNTMFEPYVAIAVACGGVLGVGAVVVGLFDLYL